MISCNYAEQTINLQYSLIKFLNYKDFVWSGESLPLKIQPLGDLMQVKVSLLEDQQPLTQVFWEYGQVFAPFQSGRSYVLRLRLEYGIPATLPIFQCDFESIHPKSYRVGLDYQWQSFKDPLGLAYKIGPKEGHLNPNEPMKEAFASGHQIQLLQEMDACSFSIRCEQEIPYAHHHFPLLRLK